MQALRHEPQASWRCPRRSNDRSQPPSRGRVCLSSTFKESPALQSNPDKALFPPPIARGREEGQTSNRLRTIDALVPPKPNEFDSTHPTATLSRRSRTIGISANSGSRCSILALSQMKPLFIISNE